MLEILKSNDLGNTWEKLQEFEGSGITACVTQDFKIFVFYCLTEEGEEGPQVNLKMRFSLDDCHSISEPVTIREKIDEAQLGCAETEEQFLFVTFWEGGKNWIMWSGNSGDDWSDPVEIKETE